MNLIQPILIFLLLVAAIFCLRFLHMRIVTRMVVVVVATTGIIFVLRPELTNLIAHKLGVGRGTDLMFYFFFLAATYAFLIVYARHRELRRDLTKLARAFAIEHAVHPNASGALSASTSGPKVSLPSREASDLDR
jgi:hypothetical protein